MTTPRLSVVVAGSRPAGIPPQLFDALRAGLDSGLVELIVSTAREPALAQAGPNVRVLQASPGATVPALRLLGLRAATAPLVAVTEDFCVPAEGWADALLAAYDREHPAAVGGPVTRQSGSAADWALTLVEYGRFFRASPEGPVPDLPSINIAYDRERLLAALPENAAGLFEVEAHARLRAAGGVFWRVPTAAMFDQSEARVIGSAVSQFHHGRLFAGRRVAGRGMPARLKFAGLSPFVPAVLLARIAREVGAAGRAGELLRALPALSVLLGAWSLGEAAGSLFGEGDSARRWT